MKQAFILSLALAAVFLAAQGLLGFRVAASLGFGLVIVTAAINALTFMWLWWARTTPLALGMTFSWAGQALLTIWFYLQLGPQLWYWNERNILLFLLLSLYLVGGGLHIAVMQRSMELPRTMMIAPFAAAIGIALGVSVLL